MAPTPKTLLDSAVVFLEESLKNFNTGSLTFAVLHVTTALELVLKERLARVHPNLIFKSLDVENLDQARTVGLQELPWRLSHLGVAVSKSDLATIREVARWRNEIVHHMPTFDRKSAVARLGEIHNFLGSFLVHQLNVDLKSVIPTELYRTASELMQEWNSVIAEAKQSASISGDIVLQEVCPSCGAKEVMTKKAAGMVRCHLCGRMWLHAGICPLCGEPAVGNDLGDSEAEVYHDECLSGFGDDWAEMQAEIRRGK